MTPPPLTFQAIIGKLNQFWQNQNCTLVQPYDMEMGAGTFHPATFLRSIGPEPWRCAYVQASRRPTDGRYGKNPNRLQRYYQYQVLLKPSPDNLQDLYLQSLEALGIDLKKHDIRFVEDNWESPTLGAWGLGWEIWLNGMEVTQFTYFQQTGGLECQLVSGELTYGLERLAIYLQGVDNVYDLIWSTGDPNTGRPIRYRDLNQPMEQQLSAYNFEYANIAHLLKQFEHSCQSCVTLIEKELPLAAYEQVIKSSHIFNLLDARKAIGVTERQRYILQVRSLSHQVAKCYATQRKEMDYPLGQIKKQQVLTQDPAFVHITRDHANLLIEIGCEELPTNSILSLSQEMETLITQQLKQAKLEHQGIKRYATPRRLAIIIQQLQTKQKDIVQLKKGPRVGAPQAAVEGFAKNGTILPELLEKKTIDGTDYWVYEEKTSGQTLHQILHNTFPKIIANLSIKKPMRWGSNNNLFARPVRWVVALMDEEIIPLELFGLKADRKTFGNRFHSSEPIELKHANDYETQLYEHYVVADPQRRRTIIEQQLSEQTKALGGTLKNNDSLLDTVNALTEWPTAVQASFPETFLSLPAECLALTLQSHQKYFSVYDKNGKILPYFITFSNLPKTSEKKIYENIKLGNQRVTVPRLEDAKFFWENDLRQPLSSFSKQFDQVVFVEGLGTLTQKNHRLKALASTIAESMGVSLEHVEQTCHLSKCDLLSDMVKEFPELQGTMGKYYALKDHIEPAIATAIEEHYLPRHANDSLPNSNLGAALAIADKLDNLVGLFAIKKQPHRQSDPFALRRSAIGIARILIDKKITISLSHLVSESIKMWQKQLKLNEEELKEAVVSFIWQRLQSWYTKDGTHALSHWHASMAANPAPTSPYDLSIRLKALQHFISLNEAKSISETNRRIKKILQKQPIDSRLEIDADRLTHEAEKTLYQSFVQIKQQISSTPNNPIHTLTLLSQLTQPIEDFFQSVMVMAEDKETRQNRLNLIACIYQEFRTVADISLLQI